MGTVWRAYDPKLRREVAVKQMQATTLGVERSRRLVAEARAMAKISHPNVVSVFDVETLDDGRLVLVMEYVPGSTLRTWLRGRPRDWPEVVAAFVEAGRGLVAAHAAGVLHRDFKPSNVLVAEEPGRDRGLVKVTDFGLAKAHVGPERYPSAEGLAPSGDRSSLSVPPPRTIAGAVLGTPRYMSPEQHRAEPLTPATDQYALCVSLWEALNDARLFGDEARLEDKLAPLPAWRNPAVPRRIVDAVGRGLAVDPEERWPGLEALLDMLEHRPRRDRWIVAGLGGLVLGGLAIAGLVRDPSPPGAPDLRCTGARKQLGGAWDEDTRQAVAEAVRGVPMPFAERSWQRVAERLDGYAEAWVAMHTESCEATTLRGEQSSEVMDLRMVCLRRAQQSLRAVAGVLRDADADVVQRVNGVLGGLPPLDRCADVEALRAQVVPPSREEVDAVEAVNGLLAQAQAARAAGRLDEARATLDQADTRLATVAYEPVRTEVVLERGALDQESGEFERAERELTEALGRASRWRQWSAMQRAAEALLVVVGISQQRPSEALRYRAVAEGLAEGDPIARAGVHHNVGVLLRHHGELEQAEAELRRAIELHRQQPGAIASELAGMANDLANVLFDRGRYVEAEAQSRRSVDEHRATLGDGHPSTVVARSNRARALLALNELEQAEAEYRECARVLEQSFGPVHPVVLTMRGNLAAVFMAQGKHAQTEAELRAVLELEREALGDEHPRIAQRYSSIGATLHAQGKLAEAEVEHRRGLAAALQALEPDHPLVAHIRFNLAAALRERGQLVEAGEHGRAALAIQTDKLGAEHPDVAETRCLIAEILLARGRADEAVEPATRAWERLAGDADLDRRAQAAFTLARALDATGAEPARVVELASGALHDYSEAGAHHADEAEEVRVWLDAHARP